MKHWKEYTLWEIYDEIESMDKSWISPWIWIYPKWDYVIASHHLNSLLAMAGFTK